MLKLLSHGTPNKVADNHVGQVMSASFVTSLTESRECAPYFAQAGQPAQRIWLDSKECAPYFTQV